MSSEGELTEPAGGTAELAAALRGRRALLVASTGGHLAQIVRWAERFELRSDSVFATFESEQSRSLLSGRPVVTLDYVPPRGLRPAISAAVRLHRETRRERFDVVLSTGAAVGISAYAIAQLRRLPMVYIESVSRFDGPSATGRILEKLPRIQRYSQHAAWADRPGWRQGPSLLDDYTVVPAAGPAARNGEGRSIFVSLGTIKPFRFDALVDAVRDRMRPGDTVTWQLGVTTRDDLPGTVAGELRSEDFDRLVAGSDVFVTHSGVGTLLRALELGVRPVVVPRLAERGEHVDDHQVQVARELDRRGLVLLRSPGELTSADLDPSGVAIRRSGDAPA
ncbi:glycosyltransferase [Blastococcus xanthinilyticus]|uniref:glycosyltransferase n=1 Tax=Blastococcus xanthinilyticus TaxID=1564164 RepID=UPI001412CA58|nr:glycosyltransferase [Blastococcus xanthinilyticus]